MFNGVEYIQARYKDYADSEWSAWYPTVENVKYDFNGATSITWEYEDGSQSQVVLVDNSSRG